MPESLPSHVEGLMAYLRQPNEKANEDLAIAFFRKLFGEVFTRQKEARQSDGYVAGCFLLELKGETKDWLSGLFQGLAYKNLNLDFGQIVVASRSFLAIWSTEDIPLEIREEVAAERGAPSAIGSKFAKKYASQKTRLLKLAIWNGADLVTPLFVANPDLVIKRVKDFENVLRKGLKVRQKINLGNLAAVLREMKTFFDPDQPIKTVRAFYSMLYSWTETSTVQISHKAKDQAALGGELISNLIPTRRLQFKEFVENRFIATDAIYDDFFARYDEALDAVDRKFRIQHGIFFTDASLSKFVMWLSKQHIPELGKNYLVIDPACGSGNLVTNWRSPLELRHKVVSEIEPELLFAVEQRMKGDMWHRDKFTVVPKVSENRGLNFLHCSAAEYLNVIRLSLEEKGHHPDKPIAFLCNPPYRSDDDQAATGIGYEVHPSILAETGLDAGSERYCCFLAQMKLVCDAAKESGLPGESLLLLFTKSAWLTRRKTFENIRNQVLGSFEHVAGALVNGSEFFDVKGTWPVAFTVWRYKGKDASLDANRSVPLLDLTWMKRADLVEIAWDEPEKVELACRRLMKDEKSRAIEIGTSRRSIRDWSEATMVDFKRDRRKAEKDLRIVGGLPLNDRRQRNKKAYGQIDGRYIGFMDDLTPCRVKTSVPDRPWFRLNAQFMDSKKNRCFSGPPTHWGYCATDLESAKKLFFWYALARTFVQRSYPMWVDSDDMWAPSISAILEKHIFATAFAIAFAENECVEAYFPANNPVSGVPELFVSNPMSPINPQSFWSIVLRPYIDSSVSNQVNSLIEAVDGVYQEWRTLFKSTSELPTSRDRPYTIDSHGLTETAGLIQIKEYAIANNVDKLREKLGVVQERLRIVKDDFFGLMNRKEAVDYFGIPNAQPSQELIVPERTKFDRIICKRLALATVLVKDLHDDPNFGRTKLAKLFYLADLHEGLNLETEYYREAAGPLDQRALYNERIGIEALAQKHHLFRHEMKGRMVRYTPSSNIDKAKEFIDRHLGSKIVDIRRLSTTFKPLNTDQTEIVATLFACWNDLLLRKRSPTDDEIVTEFLHHWHPKKSRFSRARLAKALGWMRDEGIIPKGTGRATNTKPVQREAA
jgi:hypothetical protein